MGLSARHLVPRKSRPFEDTKTAGVGVEVLYVDTLRDVPGEDSAQHDDYRRMSAEDNPTNAFPVALFDNAA